MAKVSDDPRRQKGVSPVSSLFGVLLSALFWLTLSLILSILVEWVGLFTLWEDEGVNHSIRMFSTELGYANETIANHLASDSLKQSVGNWMSTLDSAGLSANETIQSIKQSSVVHYLGLYDLIEVLFVSGFFISKVFLLRLSTLVFGLPIFFLAAWIASVDGMVERELRKAGNDRESNVIFDFAVSYSYWILMAVAVLYLTSPIPSNPIYFFLPGAFIFFMFVRTSFAMYKKYV